MYSPPLLVCPPFHILQISCRSLIWQCSLQEWRHPDCSQELRLTKPELRAPGQSQADQVLRRELSLECHCCVAPLSALNVKHPKTCQDGFLNVVMVSAAGFKSASLGRTRRSVLYLVMHILRLQEPSGLWTCQLSSLSAVSELNASDHILQSCKTRKEGKSSHTRNY